MSQPVGAGNQILGRLLTVATSPDGVVWTRPMLPLVPWGNFTHTNILLKNKGGILPLKPRACSNGFLIRAGLD